MAEAGLAVIVLAAGQGTRMKSAKPKVLHELAGRSLLGHVLTAANDLEPDFVTLVVRHQRELVEAHAQSFLPNIKISVQGDVPGTGSAVDAGLESLPEDFDGDVLIISGDVPLLDAQNLSAFVAAHRQMSSAASVLSAQSGNPTGYGRIVRNQVGAVQAIVEQRDATAEQLLIDEINSGTYVFQIADLRRALAQVGTDNDQHEKYLTDAIGVLVSEGRLVFAHQIEDATLVQGVNDRAQLAALGRVLNDRILRNWQLSGVTIIDTASTWIDIDVELGQDVTILPGTLLQGSTVVHDEVTIGPDTTLVDTEVGVGASVTRTHAISARIGADATVGPFSYLRPGTVLGEGSKVGTFVETKNVTFGAGAKVPHLSYAGDAEIGDGANIGAGTIFANYDGVHKHHSVIGKEVRTGANNVFVAPVNIGDGVYSGAGTVVRRDVPAGSLAFNKVSQVNAEGWVVKHRDGSKAAEAAQAAQADPEQ